MLYVTCKVKHLGGRQSMSNEEKEVAKFYSRVADKNYLLAFKKLGKGSNARYFESTIAEDNDGDDYERYLHLHQVVVNAGGKIYVINDEGLTELEGESTYRGSSVFLQYASECGGPVFEIQHQFHKGFVYKEVREVGDMRAVGKKIKRLACQCNFSEIADGEYECDCSNECKGELCKCTVCLDDSHEANYTIEGFMPKAREGVPQKALRDCDIWRD